MPREALRLYAPDECGPDGYPLAWHKLPVDHPLLDEADMVLPGGIKDAVRALAGNRCVRCKHPYGKGQHGNGAWSPCDPECDHDGPIRYWPYQGDERFVEADRINPALRQKLGFYRVHALWRILTVHHLDGDKANCRWWNLAALCQRCHLTIQGRVRMEQVYPYEHSEWFKPYAAGYYALTYLGEDLSREETIERLDELLGLELADAA